MFDDPETWRTIRQRSEEIRGEVLARSRTPPPAPLPPLTERDCFKPGVNQSRYFRGEFVYEYQLGPPRWAFGGGMSVVPDIPSDWRRVAKGIWRHPGGSLVTPALPPSLAARGCSLDPDYRPED